MSGHSKWATIKHKKAATGRQAREKLHAHHQGNYDRRPQRRRSRRQSAAAHRHPGRQSRQHACRQHQEGHHARHRRAGRRPDRRSHVRRLRARRRGRAGQRGHRQPQPHGERDPPRLLQERRQHGRAGRVAWMFERKSQIFVPGDKATEDQLMAIVLDAGADDLRDDGEHWEVLSAPEAHEAVLEGPGVERHPPRRSRPSPWFPRT